MEYKNNLCIPPMIPEKCELNDAGCCDKTAYQYADISACISLKPKMKLGTIQTECCGEPTVRCVQNGAENTTDIIITQKVCIKVPICYHVTASMKDDKIHCACRPFCCD